MPVVAVEVHGEEGHVGDGIGVPEPLIELDTVEYLDAVRYADMVCMEVAVELLDVTAFNPFVE